MGYRFKRIKLSIEENGFNWTAIYLLKRASKFDFFAKRLSALERNKNYPGWNSVNQNKLTWNEWDWSALGEEWTTSIAWKNKFFGIIGQLLPPKPKVIEIGPGGGRWTDFLKEKANELYLIDISQKCLDICKERFKASTNIKYNLLPEVNFSFINDNEIDIIFSYDVFVHIDKVQISDYFNEFVRVLKKEGKIILHYSRVGDKFGGFRSRFTSDDMNEILSNLHLTIVKEYDTGTLEEDKGNFSEVIAVIVRQNNEFH